MKIYHITLMNFRVRWDGFKTPYFSFDFLEVLKVGGFYRENISSLKRKIDESV